MNLGAFAIIAFLRNCHAERGNRRLRAAWCAFRRAWWFVSRLILFSLVGLPPLAGFAAKYVAFAALVQAMEVPQYRNVMLTVLVVGGLNTAISLFYYLRVVKTMAIDPEPADRPVRGFSLVSLRGFFVVAVTPAGAGVGYFLGSVLHLAQSAERAIFCRDKTSRCSIRTRKNSIPPRPYTGCW